MFCLFWLVPENTQPAASDLDISPGLFPSVAAGVVLALSVGMIVHRLVRRSDLEGPLAGGTILIELVVWAAVAVAVRLALPSIGFLPVAVAILAVGGVAVRYRTWWILRLLAVLFPLIVDIGAWHVFTVDLP